MTYEEIIAPSLILTVTGILIYWFGIFHNSSASIKINKDDHYIHGSLFLGLHVIVPLFAYQLFTSPNVDLHLSNTWCFIATGIASLITLIYLYKYVTAYKNGSFDLQEEPSIFTKIFSHRVLLIMYSYIIIATTYANISQAFTNGTLPSFIPMLLLFASTVIMSGIAVLSGFQTAKYPNVIIKMKDNSIIAGKRIKHDDFVHVIVDNKKMKIQNDSIQYIKEKL